MCVLVTGGTGLIGSSVCKILLEAGKSVVATWSTRTPGFSHPQLQWVKADLADPSSCKGLHNIDAVLHLAAATPQTFNDSKEVAELNHCIDETIFHLARSRQIPLIYTSSIAVYGIERRSKNPLDGSAPLAPIGDYSEEKVWAEETGFDLSARAELPFISLRICAPYGPEQKKRSVMTIFIERALRGEPLTYHGSGSREQDFIHVEDIGRAFLLALKRKGSGAFNIASGNPVTMKELALMIARKAGLDESFVYSSGQEDSQEGYTARFDIISAERKLGWKPTISLSDGITQCIEYRKEPSTA